VGDGYRPFLREGQPWRFMMAAASGSKILCIDDDETELWLTQLLLEKAGYNVVTARSGQQALEALSSASFDLVLADHLLRGMTGAEVAKKIKELHPHLLVVLFSGLIEPPTGSEAYIDMFISKDGPEQMLESIASLLNQGRPNRGPRTSS
jgi:two-component system alkaline phosphatase synthesis response regulator PhoP